MRLVLEEKRVLHFGSLLARSRRKRVREADLWARFQEVFPHCPMGQERQWLWTALSMLAEAGKISLPSIRGQQWDRSMRPHLPRMILCQSEAQPDADESWRHFPWHPRLIWVSDLPHLSDEQVAFLHKVQEGLREGWFERKAPLRHRSLQLTGKEKRLHALVKQSIFGEGRLSLELLGCYREHAPLAWERVGPGGRMIVFENAGPFQMAREVLASLTSPPYGMVAYGGGAGFRHSVRYLGTLQAPCSEVRYVGDLDRPGMRIAQAAARVAETERLPPLLPATEVHLEMLAGATRLGRPRGWPHRTRREAKLAMDEFLEPEVREQVLPVLEANRRIPEEVLGPEDLMLLWN